MYERCRTCAAKSKLELHPNAGLEWTCSLILEQMLGGGGDGEREGLLDLRFVEEYGDGRWECLDGII